MSKAHLQALFKDASEQVEGSPLTTSGQDQQPSKYIVAVVQNRAKEVHYLLFVCYHHAVYHVSCFTPSNFVVGGFGSTRP